MLNEKINLIAAAGTYASPKAEAQGGTSTTVFGEKQSVKRADFYPAVAAGLVPQATFIVWTAEYSEQEYVGYGSDYYKVVRSYDRPDLRTELICTKL